MASEPYGRFPELTDPWARQQARGLMQRIEGLGVNLTADGDHIRYDGPVGAMTPGLRWQVRAQKNLLLHELKLRTQPAPQPVSRKQQTAQPREASPKGHGYY